MSLMTLRVLNNLLRTAMKSLLAYSCSVNITVVTKLEAEALFNALAGIIEVEVKRHAKKVNKKFAGKKK